MWEVAAGIIIGGGVLGLIWAGLSAEIISRSERRDSTGYGYLIALVGAGIGAWVIFFKVHF